METRGQAQTDEQGDKKDEGVRIHHEPRQSIHDFPVHMHVTPPSPKASDHEPPISPVSVSSQRSEDIDPSLKPATLNLTPSEESTIPTDFKELKHFARAIVAENSLLRQIRSELEARISNSNSVAMEDRINHLQQQIRQQAAELNNLRSNYSEKCLNEAELGQENQALKAQLEKQAQQIAELLKRKTSIPSSTPPTKRPSDPRASRPPRPDSATSSKRPSLVADSKSSGAQSLAQIKMRRRKTAGEELRPKPGSKLFDRRSSAPLNNRKDTAEPHSAPIVLHNGGL